jgi:hypothetical protein
VVGWKFFLSCGFTSRLGRDPARLPGPFSAGFLPNWLQLFAKLGEHGYF